MPQMLKHKGLWISVLVVTIAACICTMQIFRDERRLSAIVPGMTFSAVQESLGSPTDTFRLPLPPIVAPRRCGTSTEIVSALLFERSLRDSLVVYLNREGRVVCVERGSIAYTVHPLRGG